MDKSSPHVSVIIPVYNGEATIAAALTAVGKQKYARGFEVIVVDDGSTDATAKIAASFKDARYFRQDNAGPAAARNRGAAEARGEVLVFTDADCVPRADWLSRLLRHLPDDADEDRSLFDRIAAVAGSYGIANPRSRLARGVWREIVYRHARCVPDRPEVFGSYNVAVRRDVFNELGGFDEGYAGASGEDNDLSYRLRRAGYQIAFARDALVDHHHPESVARYVREQFRHGFWRAKMYRDHPDMARGDGYTFWKDMAEVPLSALSVLALPGVFLTGPAAPSMAAPFLGFTLILLAIQIFFAFRMVPGFIDAQFFSLVTFVRAYARTAGLAAGVVNVFFSRRSR